jgi:hypothetical protein
VCGVLCAAAKAKAKYELKDDDGLGKGATQAISAPLATRYRI